MKPKVKAFCEEYVVDFNGAAAAERAGYRKLRARITASELLCRPEAITYIKELTEQRKERTELDGDRIIKELEAIAYARATDFVKVKDVMIGEGRTSRKVRVAYIELTSDVEEEKQKAISEIRQTKEGIALKVHDKVKALELLGRHAGIFEKDNKQRKPEVNLGDLPVTFE